jgi:hypothetical protein
MRLAIALTGLVLLVGLSPAAGAAGHDTLQLVPDWPDSFDQARREPIPLLPGPPVRERVTHAALEPGSRTAGTSHTFHWSLQNPDGTIGPAGPLFVDTSRQAVLEVHLSAGPPEAPGQEKALPTDAGAAPHLTVDPAVTVAGETLDPEPVTKTLVNPPGGDRVHRYAWQLGLETTKIPQGAGLSVDLAVHQVSLQDEQTTQPMWRIHTGSQHPSGLTLGLEPAEPDDGSSFTFDSTEPASQERTRQGAYAALAASLVAAGGATIRGYRQLGD